MKIDWGRVLRIAGRLIVAAPAIADAAKPVLRKKRSKARNAGIPVEPAPEPDTAPGQGLRP